MPSYDLITLGEAMIRLSPPDFERLEQAPRWQVRVGGAEWNVACAVARLGLRAAWVSRLTRNPLGLRIAAEARAHGAITDHVVWTDEDRVGVYYLEPGPPPRGSQVIYDRAGSAASRLRPEHLDLGLFAATRALHLSGITPALGESCRAAALAAVDATRATGAAVSFDINYRARLWSPEAAAAALIPFCERADTLILGRADAALLFGVEGVPADVVAALQDRFGPRTVVLTLSREGACAATPDGQIVFSPALAPTIIDRVGAGDSFAAGLLYGLLRGRSLSDSLAYGNALAAFKLTVPGDVGYCGPDELETLVAGQFVGLRR
jgi:2-dehydro-3-deoxygluconokinase